MTNAQVFSIAINVLSIIMWMSLYTINIATATIKKLNGEKTDVFDFILFKTLPVLLFMFLSIFSILKTIQSIIG